MAGFHFSLKQGMVSASSALGNKRSSATLFPPLLVVLFFGFSSRPIIFPFAKKSPRSALELTDLVWLVFHEACTFFHSKTWSSS